MSSNSNKPDEGFIKDIREYYGSMKDELNALITEVLPIRNERADLYAFMIPFASDILGVVLNDREEKYFDAREIRIKFGENCCSDPTHPKFDELSDENISQDYKDTICLEECEKYGKKPPSYPYIRRLGAIPTRLYIKDISDVIENSIRALGFTFSDNVIFSNWIKFGENMVFFATDFPSQRYLQYKAEVDRVESDKDDWEYKYFLDTLIQNFQERWSEHLYYGLTYSTTEYMAGKEAIIQYSANDVLEKRNLPEFSIISQLANTEYEGSFSNGVIRFLDDFTSTVQLTSFVKFEVNNLREIRKLLEISKGNICLDVLKERKEIIGYGILDDSSLNDTSTDDDIADLYSIHFHGKNSWELYNRNTALLRFEKGQFKVPLDIKKDDVLQKLKDKFQDDFNEGIANIIIAAIHQKRGTMIVVSPNAKAETDEILQQGKGKGLDKINLTNLPEEMITQLCAVDGALMIDPYGNCSGIGLILPNSSDNRGDSSRGARFNSAKAYSDQHKDDFICVISEDGMVDFFLR